MGRYIDIGNEGFRQARRGEYVDKSGLIGIVNSTLRTEFKYSCVSRARRFGKSMAAKMLSAYYDRSCSSRELFQDLEIARTPSFEEYLNKFPVIYIDLSEFMGQIVTHDEHIVKSIQQELKKDVLAAFPDLTAADDDSLMSVLYKISETTGEQFVMIIDEWDAICREYPEGTKVMDDYVAWLRTMFKGVSAAKVFAGVYMTGILPIKKYDTQSALNNFQEYSMIYPGSMAPFFGFTSEEVKMLSARYGMDYDELEKWYDGYQIGDQTSMFNPNSVMQAVTRHRCSSYWGKTAAYDIVATYIKMKYEGLEDNVISMLAGERVKVFPDMFQNDMKEVLSRDDVLTVLIHLGYLSFDWNREVCYLPNREVALEMEKAVKKNNWRPVVDAIEASERLLDALLRGDADAVARGVESVHRQEVSLFKYNDENSLACVISLAFYAARNDFHVHREYQTGDGYADLVLIPRKNVAKPAVIIELKYNKTVDSAISQIKRRRYPEKVADYTGRMLLVGISYDESVKEHTCQIESWEK